jgi:hypothetical protein
VSAIELLLTDDEAWEQTEDWEQGDQALSMPQTPYQRLLDSPDVPRQAKQQLKRTYQELNPAQLTREIGRLQQALLKAFQKKNKKRRAA